MKGHNQMRAALLLALGMGMSQLASAFGLGPIEVNSSIGQPLDARIKVTGMNEAQAKQTSIQLADTSAYQSRGMKKLPSHEQIRFSLVPQGSDYTIHASTAGGVREPFINFLLTVTSNGETVTREYAVFLNPDLGAQAGLSPVVTAPARPEATAASDVAISSPPASSEDRPNLLVLSPASAQSTGWQGAPATAPATSSYSGKTYGPVQPGETLYSIANKVMPAGYNNNTAMRQIYNANRAAFASRSLSSLMAGYVLTIPDFNQVSATPARRSSVAKSAMQQPVAAKPTPATALSDQAVDSDAVANENTQALAEDKTDVPRQANTEQVELLNPDAPNLGEMAQDTVNANMNHAHVEPANILAENDMGQALANGHTLLEVEQTSTQPAVPTIAVQPEPTLPTPEKAASETQPKPTVQPNTQFSTSATSNPPAPVASQQETTLLNQIYFLLPNWQWLIIIGVFLLAIIAWLFERRLSKAKAVNEEEFDLEPEEMQELIAQIKSFEEADEPHDLPQRYTSFTDDFEGMGISDAELAALDQQSESEDMDDVFSDDVTAEEDMFVDLSDDPFSDTKKQDDDIFAEDELFADFKDTQDDDVFADLSNDKALFADMSETEDDIFSDNSEQDDWFDLDADDAKQVEAAIAEASAEQSQVAEDDFLMDWSEVEKKAQQVEPQPSKPQATTNRAENADNLFMDFDAEESSVLASETDLSAQGDAELAGEDYSEEMEINLDVASSFMVTGNSEKAKKWLEEVLTYGNAEQKSRARDLLNEIQSD